MNTIDIIQAAENEQELAWLKKIVSSKWDLDCLRQYRSWVGNHFENKNKFLSEYIPAVESRAAELPDSSALSKPWRDILGVTIQEELRSDDYYVEEGESLLDLQDVIYLWARPSLLIRTTPAADEIFAVGATKFGGKPDLPVDFEWPEYKGNAVGFRGQININDLKTTLIADKLPPGGLLSIFVYEDAWENEPGGFGSPGGHRVYYFPPNIELVRNDAAKKFIDGNQPGGPCKLEILESFDLPCAYDHNNQYRFTGEETKIVGGEDELESLFQNIRQGQREITPPSKLFGYGRPGHYSIDPAPNGWSHLLSLDSDDNLGWCWSDGHVMFISINPADLKKGDFSNTTIIDG